MIGEGPGSEHISARSAHEAGHGIMSGFVVWPCVASACAYSMHMRGWPPILPDAPRFLTAGCPEAVRIYRCAYWRWAT